MSEDSTQEQTLSSHVSDETIERMFKVGAHFGYSKSRRHPSMKPFIFGMKNRVEIFDLEKTKETLAKAKVFVEELGRARKTILLVSGKREAVEFLKNAAGTLSMPFVAGRWIGGTFTNLGEIRKRVEKLLDLTDKREKGELAKYTKKERLLIDRDISNLEEMFRGIVPMKKLPEALFVIDPTHEETAVTEAHKTKVPVVALMSSDCDLSFVEYPIVANDSSLSSISFFIAEIVGAYEKGLKEAPIEAKSEIKEKMVQV